MLFIKYLQLEEHAKLYKPHATSCYTVYLSVF